MSHTDNKPQADTQYELLYHPQIPGRGEFVRLALEAAGVSYIDVANDQQDGYADVQRVCMTDSIGAQGNPPVFSPPALRIPAAHPDVTPLIIHQTANILIYIGERHGLLARADALRFHTQQLIMTALDLNDEIHDTHHPINTSEYYEKQKDAALAKAKAARQFRFPKFFSYFERTLKYNQPVGHGVYLVGSCLTIADLTVWQVIDGTMFAFPKEMSARKKEFPQLLGRFYDHVKDEPKIKQYLSSPRRLPYGMGIFRNYEELDRQDE